MEMVTLSLPVRGAWIEIVAGKRAGIHEGSLPVRGAWIEMEDIIKNGSPEKCRSPCGERGLKCRPYDRYAAGTRRSPCGERGLKYFRRCVADLQGRRSPCGERGLKSLFPPLREALTGRSPCGERGLKSAGHLAHVKADFVAPRAGSVD